MTTQLEELARRHAAARDAMRTEGLDALLVIGGPNLSYLGGYPGIERTMARAMYYLFPLEGQPTLIVHAFRFDQARRYTTIRDVRRFDQLTTAPVDVIRQAFSDHGLLSARVGVELGYETQLNTPVEEYLRLSNELETVTWVDAARVLWSLRFRKSAFELDRIRRAGRIAATAISHSFAAARPGMSEAEFGLMTRLAIIRASGGDAYAVVVTGEGNYDLPNSLDGRVFEPGAMVFIDAGCSAGGYWMEHSRAAVVGPPSADQIHVQRHVYEATMAGVKLVRPGVPLAEVAAACGAHLDRLEVPITSNISTNSGRYGHSFGMEAIEPPHISETETVILAPGMVLAVEPGVSTAFGRFHIRHNVLVTEDGHEVLDGPPWELQTIS